MNLEEYIERHSQEEPDYLKRLVRKTNLYMLYPRMCSGHVQGRLLKMLTQMIRPKRVLELGTYTGYSALCIAEGLEEGARLDTVEIEDELEEFLTDTFSQVPHGNRIHLHIGDFSKLMSDDPDLQGPFDLVFMDANKRDYPKYYREALPLLKPGGYIFADNTLWDEHVVNDTEKHDAQTRGIMEFNDLVAGDNRVEKVIIPIRDGLTIIRKNK